MNLNINSCCEKMIGCTFCIQCTNCENCRDLYKSHFCKNCVNCCNCEYCENVQNAYDEKYRIGDKQYNSLDEFLSAQKEIIE